MKYLLIASLLLITTACSFKYKLGYEAECVWHEVSKDDK